MNKSIKISLIVGGITLLMIFGLIFKNYYDETYIGKSFYLQVPANQDTKLEEWQEDKYTIKGKKYKFTAYGENLEKKLVEFNVTNDYNPNITEKSLLQPYTYIKVKASKKRVINWIMINENEVPTKVLKEIKKNNSR